MSDEIKSGSVVRLKSGGPAMTVTKVGRVNDWDQNDSAWCSWFDQNKPMSQTFALEALELDTDY